MSINDIEMLIPGEIRICQVAVAAKLQIVENHTLYQEKSLKFKGFFLPSF
jgi:hypothetical protein